MLYGTALCVFRMRLKCQLQAMLIITSRVAHSWLCSVMMMEDRLLEVSPNPCSMQYVLRYFAKLGQKVFNNSGSCRVILFTCPTAAEVLKPT